MNEHRMTRMSAAAVSVLLLSIGLLHPIGAAAADAASDTWLEIFERECKHSSGVQRKRDCEAFAERISALADPPPEARLALFMAHDRLDGNGPDSCGTMRRIVADMQQEHPYALLFLAICALRDEGEELAKRQKAVSLMRRAVAADPEHDLSLSSLILIGKVPAYRGEYPYLPAAEFAGYAAAHYRMTGDAGSARLAFEGYLDAGDTGRAYSIRDRVRDDLSLEELDLSPTGRGGSLSVACSDDVIRLGLAGHCLTAFADLLGASGAAGEAVPDDVLAHLEDALRRQTELARVADGWKDNERLARRLSHASWAAGRKAREAAGLRALLESHPPSLRSSEHHRVLAGTAPSWGGRIEMLRSAVELDGGNLAATCDLAGALAATGSLDEARALYAELAAADDRAPCGAEEAFRDIGFLESSSYKGAGLDDPLH